jgi:hypothetical protein
MKSRSLRTWPPRPVPFECATDGKDVWLNPGLPPTADRPLHPLHVEIACWYNAPDEAAEALGVVQRLFEADSVLAAIVHENALCRFLMYTACSEEVAHARYCRVRAALRPSAIGLQIALDPTWDSLGEALPATVAVARPMGFGG